MMGFKNQMTNICKQNVFLKAAMRYPAVSLEKFFEKALEVLNREEIQSMFKETNEDGHNIFHCSVINEHCEVFKFLLNSHLTPLSGSEKNDLIMAIDKRGRSLLMLSLAKLKFEEIEFVIELLKTFP